ncbi:MAG: RNA polymerase sigma factor FliA [Burkholderiaceae bacterium]|nr:RNA polymerase sigma factor FliA [Burkholderiaceae bacterium]MEB2350374.1 RNA polymerase sigma factor FliA [Burkholderiaceae bacterium]
MYTAHGTLDRDAVVERYGPMVRRIASQLAAKLPANVDPADLAQAGMIGLLDALSRYETGHGAQFETFAMQRVRGAMLDELRGSDWLPRSVRRAQRTIEQAIHAAEQRLQRAPRETEIAAELGLRLDAYQQMLADARGAQLVYLDDFGDDGEEGFLDRHVPAAGTDPTEILGDAGFTRALVDAIERLPERERLVMGMYYEQDMNLKEIGAVLGVTESRVSQLHSQAVARLRTQMTVWT